MKYSISLFAIVLAAIAFTGCEKQEYLKSESEIKKELSYSWREILMVKKYPSTRYMIWTFKDDSLVIELTCDSLISSSAAPMDVFRGKYSINTTLTKVFINTSSFPNDAAWYWLNAEWTVVFLDNSGLVIASEDPQAGGINEREFVRTD